MPRLTLHLRMTRACNADCSYCSSWREDPQRYMKPADFKRGIDFIISDVLPLMGFRGRGGALSLEYIGGEILSMPMSMLKECVLHARERFEPLFNIVRDGAQSNLIGPPRKLAMLTALFGRRIGTSVDSAGSQRTLKGSPALYRERFEASRAWFRERRAMAPGAIVVVDATSLADIPDEIARAEAEGYDLTLRPVFHGGRDVHPARVEDIATLFGRLADDWLMKGRVRIEPFRHLTASRLANLLGDPRRGIGAQSCPFQNNCAEVSLNLDPDGTLYLCLDMADSSQLPLGNAFEGRIDADTLRQLQQRRDHLDTSCRACPWLRECSGGCMSEAVHATGSIYGKTLLCPVWKTIFARIDAAIARHGAPAVAAWLDGLDEPPPVRRANMVPEAAHA